MSATRFDSIQKVLRAMKRAETAKLQSKLTEIRSARLSAQELRRNSAAQSPVSTAAEMQAQSLHQQNDEWRARTLEQEAAIAEGEASEMRRHLTLTLGREQAADLLASQAVTAERAERERRAETVPKPGTVYAPVSPPVPPPSPGTSSDGTE